MPEILIEPGSMALAQAAARRIARRIQTAIAAQGHCSIALAGGTTPREAYSALARLAAEQMIAWEQVQIFWGDERWVPGDHPDSNARMAREAWLNHVPIPAANVHPVSFELGDPQAAAAAYEQTIRRGVPASTGELPRLDLVLLGLGPDGHTASLFPGTPALGERDRLVVAQQVETLGAWRITLTAPLINAAAEVLFLVAGDGKAQVLQQVLEGPHDPLRLPAQLIRPGAGRLTWMLDAAAARLLRQAPQHRRAVPGAGEPG